MIILTFYVIGNATITISTVSGVPKPSLSSIHHVSIAQQLTIKEGGLVECIRMKIIVQDDANKAQYMYGNCEYNCECGAREDTHNIYDQ